jgi:hypothetical protein
MTVTCKKDKHLTRATAILESIMSSHPDVGACESEGERTLEQVREELGWGDVDDGSVELEQDDRWRN